MPTASFDIDYAARQLFRHFIDEWRARPALPPVAPLLGGLGLPPSGEAAATMMNFARYYRLLQQPPDCSARATSSCAWASATTSMTWE